MKKALLKDSLKEIKKTYKRFVSILLMALLGVGFFAGVRASSPDMKLTIDKYFDEKNVYDIEVLSTLGITDDDIKALKEIDGVENAYGTYSEDVIVRFEDEETVVKVLEFEENINTPNLISGDFPKSKEECVIDEEMAKYKNVAIGDYIEIEEQIDEDDEEKSYLDEKLKVVGIVNSPIYISRDKGTTTLGSGKISYIIYTTKNNINSDIYTEAFLKVKGSESLQTISDKYDLLISNVKNNIETIKEERQTARYDELIKEANEKLDDAQKKLDDEKKNAEQKIADAEKEIADGKKELADGEKKIKDAEKELQDGKDKADVEFKNAEAKISSGETELANNQLKIEDAITLFESKKQEAESGISQIDSGLNTINTQLIELQQNKELATSVLSAIAKIDQTVNNINLLILDYQNQINNGASNSVELQEKITNLQTSLTDLNLQKAELLNYGITQETLTQIENGIAECNSQKQSLEKQKKDIQNQLSFGEAEIVNGQNKIADARNQLEVAKSQLANEKNNVASEFVKAEKEIAKGKNEITENKKKLEDGEKELTEKKEEFNTKISDAEAKMIDAREKVNDIENAKWYILDRYDNAGFNSYSQDADNIAKIGDVFPVVFFLIAILISLTSMTRMIEEERVQIGTLKALGYNNFQIMSKYVLYSLIATVVGGIIGSIIGTYFLPNIIISMYQMMYTFKEKVITFNFEYSTIGMLTMIACIVGATIYTAYKELKGTPADLMRPKAPKPGKRVLLEKIPFIWKQLSFTQKVTVRNMFRYKKKFLMTIVGICGCTALILAGFGLKDSIAKIMDYQYIGIYDYDMMIALKGTLTSDEIQSVKTEIEDKEEIKKCIPIYMESDKVANGENEEDVQLVVSNNSNELNEVIRLKDLKTGEILSLDSDSVIITDKLSQLINAKVGDEIVLKDSDKNEFKVKVGGIVEHYISHYVYMNSEMYEKTFGEKASTNVLYAQYTNELTQDKEYELSESILSNSKTASITLTSKLMQTMNDTLSALNTVVYILIVSAGILAFVVLYNLATINISERIRELATIKVLGFYDKEVYDYVTREIVLLTIIGILFGLIFGYVLNAFILGTCEIGILRFRRIILPQSYLFAALITIVFTFIVNIVTYFSLKKINMIESLKSIE